MLAYLLNLHIQLKRRKTLKLRNHFHFLIPAARLLFAAFLLLQVFASSAGIALAEEDQPGVLYILTNAATGNAVRVYAWGGEVHSHRLARFLRVAPAAGPGSDRRTR
jgi:hypothetical protein